MVLRSDFLHQLGLHIRRMHMNGLGSVPVIPGAWLSSNRKMVRPCDFFTPVFTIPQVPPSSSPFFFSAFYNGPSLAS